MIQRLLIFLNLIVAGGVTYLAFSEQQLKGEDENLFYVGIVWIVWLVIFNLLIVLVPRLGKLPPLIFAIFLPIFTIVALDLTPYTDVDYIEIFTPLGFVIYLLFTGNILWLLWLLNLIYILKLKKDNDNRRLV